MTESQHQKTLFDWTRSVRKEYPKLKLLHHIPNGGSRRDAIEGHRLKQQGVKAGVPDLCLPVAKGGYHGLYIELKADTGIVSTEQEWWMNELKAEGYCTAICYGWESARGALEWYLTLKN